MTENNDGFQEISSKYEEEKKGEAIKRVESDDAWVQVEKEDLD